MPQSKNTVSKTPKIKTEWDLTLLYKSINDPQIEKDMEAVRSATLSFEKKYRNNTSYLKTDIALLKTLEDYEELVKKTANPKPYYYLEYLRYLNGDNKLAESRLNKLTAEIIEYANKLVFFEVGFKNVPANKQKEFLVSSKLAKYHYFLKKTFENNKHILTEAEEKILNLKSQPAHMMWENSSSKLQQRQTIKWKDKEVPLSEARGMVQNLGLKDRRALFALIVKNYKENLSDFSEAEMNALVTDKKINDALRGFKMPYSSTILHYENDEHTVVNLAHTVTKRFDISKRFYKLKAKLLKLPKLEVADVYANIGATKKEIPFEEAYKIVEEVFERAGSEFKEILTRFASNGQIDVFPKKGKRGGAFMSPAIDMPSFVFLNHLPDFHSTLTLAHEMGHAIHTELSKTQPVIYEDYTISAAEVASTFFEGMVFDEVFEKLSDKEKVIALHDKIGDEIATIFRQIACFNFETELHTAIREKGSLGHEEMAALMAKHLGAYFGPAVNTTLDSGYIFTVWTHIRGFFYTYTYAYGLIISKALYAKYKKDPSYIHEIKKFLSAGGSMSPDDIFKSIGINTRDPKFFEEGLKQIEEDIKRLEKLTK